MFNVPTSPGFNQSRFLSTLSSNCERLNFQDIAEVVDGVPYINTRNARYLYDMILRERCSHVLELGIAHGAATCYIAAAIKQLGGGRVTAVDLVNAEQKFSPRAEDLVVTAGLQSLVEIHRMQTGYNWFLHDEIVRQTRDERCEPKYDLCIIDGPKNWTIDSSAFFLVDKLLKPGGWIIFDDYHWSYSKAEKKRDATDGISHRSLSPRELQTPHIREVFELLVKQHPDYGNLTLWQDADWAMAQKITTSIKQYQIQHTTTTKDVVAKWVSKTCRQFRDFRHHRR